QLFEKQVLLRPQATALTQNGQALSYAELNEASNQLAHRLIASGIKLGERVGLCTHRNFDMIIGMMAILKAGAAYVPVDPSYPLDRQQYIAKQSHIRYWLTDQTNDQNSEAQSILISDPENQQYPTSNPSVECSGEDLAYIIFTSGSTGRPKGVMIRHHSVVNLISWVNQRFEVGATDRVLLLTSMCFDLSVYDIFGLLAAGGSICIAEQSQLRDVESLQRLLQEEQITFWDTVPTTLDFLVSELEQYQSDYRQHSLRLIFNSGDWIPVQLPEKCRQFFPNAAFVSLGGATEATVWSNYYLVNELPSDCNSIPYGKPIDNNFFYILDANGQAVPQGVIGELYIGGVGIADGYVNDPEKTAAAFVNDPFFPDFGGRMYRTGDLGRLMADGNIEFLGRRDQQVKIRGFRVELGEIESKMNEHPKVKSALITTFGKNRSQQRIAAYYLSTNGAVPTEDLQQYLGESLPNYMIPSQFIRLDAFPLNGNGKIDRKALQQLVVETVDENHVAPASELEGQLQTLWAEVLEVETPSVTADFFELGGHSLTSVRLLNRISEQLGHKLSFSSFSRASNIRAISKQIESMTEKEELAIAPVDLADAYPLSPSQNRMWMAYRLNGQLNNYNIQGLYNLTGDLDKENFERALQYIIARHESLRTRFDVRSEKACQIIVPADEWSFAIDWHDLRGETEAEASFQNTVEFLLESPYTLEDGPLLRVDIWQMGDREYRMLFGMHHIIADAWSVEVLTREWGTVYQFLQKGQTPQLPPLSIQYKDYASWASRRLESSEMQEQKAYWQETLRHLPQPLELPLDHPRPQQMDFEGTSLRCELPVELYNRLKGIAQQSGNTLYVCLVAALKLYLNRLSGQRDIILGMPIANRNHRQLQSQIGFYNNLLPLRTHIDESKGFDDLLQMVRKQVLDAYDHSEYPLENILEDLDVERKSDRQPLFDVLIEFLNEATTQKHLSAFPDIEFEECPMARRNSKFDLSFLFREINGHLLLDIEYRSSLFDASTIERLRDRFFCLLETITNQPKKSICQLNDLPINERQQLLDWARPNGEALPYCSLKECFEAKVAECPDAPAVGYGRKELTYRQLNEWANGIARQLQEEHQLQAGDLVAIYTDRSCELIAGLLGSVKAGVAFLPIDPSYPMQRIQYLLEDSGAKIMLTDSHKLFDITMYFDGGFCLLDDESVATADNPSTESAADELAYVIYTSGSTGQPKGVEITQGSISQYIRWANAHYFAAEGQQSMPLFTSISFDLTLTCIFSILLRGDCLTIYPQTAKIDRMLAAIFNERGGIKAVKMTPSHVRLLPFLNLSSTSVQTVILGGEALQSNDLAILRKLNPSINIFNEYGPTEATVGCTVEKMAEKVDRITIGRPIDAAEIYILDAQQNLCPIGSWGELCIGGNGLALGYRHRPELTAEKFVENTSLREESVRLYRSGDIARWLPDGRIEYKGREDEQFKIRGHRVELGEIEAGINALDGVAASAVLASELDGEKLLTAYVVLEGSAKIESLRNALSFQLPDYLVPEKWEQVNSIPLTNNGKIDKVALLEQPKDAPVETNDYLKAAETDTEICLVEIWKQYLKLEAVGIDQDFFQLGGHSLKGVNILMAIQERLQVKLELQDIFSCPTIAELAEKIDRSKTVVASIPAIDHQESYPLSAAQQRVWTLSNLSENDSTYHITAAFQLKGELDKKKFVRVLNELVKRHEILRTNFTDVDGELRQIIRPADIAPVIVEWDAATSNGQPEDWKALLNEERVRP
ncbi:MAG: amino acid adenylation domain-containing protein, partial [Bacteroidota bacterium]